MIEATIDQKIVSKLGEKADVDMSRGDANEPRITAIEQQLQQLQQSQQSIVAQARTFEKKLDYFSQHVEAQGSRLAQTMEEQLANQMTRIEALMN